jgi:hypothetical protein
VKAHSPWITWLQIVLAALLGYSLVLVFAGSVAGAWFSALGFGPPERASAPEVRSYLKLPFMVLGAVMAGWTVMMIQIVRGPLREGSAWARSVLISSLVVWFVLDTGMSLILGFPLHALFNVPFAVALAIPLIKLRSC